MLKLSFPIMLANMTVPLVGAVDTAVMGRMADPAYIGATAIGATIFSSIFWIFGFLRMGTGGLVAQSFGAGKKREIERITVRALLLALLIGLCLTLMQGLFLSLASLAFNTSEQLWSLVRDYFCIRIYSAPATLMVYASLGALIGLQKMWPVMIVQLVLNFSNIVLNIFFFAVMEWGIKGVALASVIADYLSLLVAISLLLPHLSLSKALLRDRELFSRAALLKLMKVNGNLFIRTLCLTIAFYWMTAASSNLGELTLAANAILFQMLHLMAYALDGFSHTAETLGGQAYGKRDRWQFDKTARTCTELGVAFSVIIALIYWFGGSQIIAMMTTLEQVRAHASNYLIWVALAPMVSVGGFLLDGIYIGVTHTREMRNAMLISLAIFLFASLWMVSVLENHGLWVAYHVLMLARTGTLLYWYPNITKALNPVMAIDDNRT